MKLCDGILEKLLKENINGNSGMEIEAGALENINYHRLAFNLENNPKVVEMINMLDAKDATLVTNLLNSATVYLAAAGQTVVIGNGKMEPAYFVKAVKQAAGAEQAFIDSPEAKAMLEKMRCRQLGVNLLKVRFMAALFMENLIRTQTISEEGKDIIRDAIEDMDQTDDMMGFAHGAKDGGFAWNGCSRPKRSTS